MLAASANSLLDMDYNLVRCLLEALPLNSEEDDLREEVSECELLNRLPGPEGPGVVKCIRRIFEACGLLDPRLLVEDKWAFTSFPASLFGHSLLQTLATPSQQLVARDYWRSTHSGDIEEQRKLLNNLENRRTELHPTRSPYPIRFVYVAWGIIRLGDSFLLHHREDRSRPEVKNYVFPGGRFRPLDLPAEKSIPDTLRQLHKAESILAIGALEQTLRRELREELDLRFSEDWSATEREVLKPYRKIEGARNTHALTEYVIALYDISLTPEGEARLLNRIDEEPDKLAWFNIPDIVRSTGRTDGKRAFLDALTDQHGPNLASFLDAVPSSSTIEYQFIEQTEAVELPASPGIPVLIGETGKEKARSIDLSGDEHALLLLLGAWGKGLDPKPEPSHLNLLPGGWVKVKSAKAKTTLESLQARLVGEDLPLLQQVGENYVRFSVRPECLFFGGDLFGYRLSTEGDQKGVVTVELRLPDSVWIKSQFFPARSILVPKKMLSSLSEIESGTVGPGGLEHIGYSDESMKKNCKEMLDKETRKLGLRKLVRLSGKKYQLSATRIAG